MSDIFLPQTAEDVRQAIAWAAAENQPLAVQGNGSKARLGRPVQAAHLLDLSRLSGVLEYEPAELVLTARPATLIADIETLLGEQRQILAFEPPDFGPLWGMPPGRGTLGGAIGANLAGPRRFKIGAMRDHLLGFQAVTGRGELVKNGAKVVKNVTGYDLSKLLCGAFGTLAAIVEANVKVLPAPEKTRTILVYGLSDAAAVQALAEAAQSPHEVSGLAHLPADMAARSGVGRIAAAGQAVTLVRVEGTDVSVLARCAALHDLLGRHGALDELHSLNSAWAWREIRDASLLALPLERVLWRISVAPMQGPALVASLRHSLPGLAAFYDWAGGLIWLALPPSEDAGAGLVRQAVAASGGGHATLFRAEDALRAALPVFQPQEAALAALSLRVKQSFDPKHILNPGRMEAGV
ncbi:glycolate oxidase subunit GlcE [Ferrovibrio sp.]|uniref:glycolate oxidase subunit GlcE n=1 Tax=Ferrovibrio sp. TaxID=1917215 RepID=UPI001B54CAAE|nr:glycolate oxidase subunit GlcE [Ferrovibrio sp.]MBP7064642.1 glycolate oxidase subunit GlcE [Ferrovibrio sp.]